MKLINSETHSCAVKSGTDVPWRHEKRYCQVKNIDTNNLFHCHVVHVVKKLTCTVSLASLAILAFGGRDFFMILEIFAIGKNRSCSRTSSSATSASPPLLFAPLLCAAKDAILEVAFVLESHASPIFYSHSLPSCLFVLQLNFDFFITEPKISPRPCCFLIFCVLLSRELAVTRRACPAKRKASSARGWWLVVAVVGVVGVVGGW